MRTLKPITLSLFVSALALAACQARGATPLLATSTPAATSTARVIVITATSPAYPGRGYAATSVPSAAAPTVMPAAPYPAPTQAAPTQAPPSATVPPTPDPNERVGSVL